MKIRYRWTGPAGQGPMHGHILAAARGKVAYLVLAVDNRGRRTVPEPHELLVLTVQHCSRAVLDDPAVGIYGIVWDKRARGRQLHLAHTESTGEA